MLIARTWFFGTAVLLAVNPLITLVQTLLETLAGVRLEAPLTQYFLQGHLPCLAAGVFVARSGSAHKIFVSALVGVTGFAANRLLAFRLPESLPAPHDPAALPVAALVFANGAALSALLVAGACTLTCHAVDRVRGARGRGMSSR